MAEPMFRLDAREVREAIRRAPRVFDRLLVRAVQVSAHEGVRIMIPLQPGKEAGRGLLKGSTGVGRSYATTLDVNSEILVRSAYASWADKGRPPGKMPPHDPIEAWVKRLGAHEARKAEERKKRAAKARKERKERKGRSKRATRKAAGAGKAKKKGSRRRGIAALPLDQATWLVRLKIAQKGTFTPNKPPNFTQKTVKKLKPVTERHVANAVRAFAREFNA